MLDDVDRAIYNQRRRTYWANNPSYSKHHNERHVQRDHAKLSDSEYKSKYAEYNRDIILGINSGYLEGKLRENSRRTNRICKEVILP